MLKLIRQEEDKQTYDDIESIILNLNVKLYAKRVNSQNVPIKNLLLQVSKRRCLIGAALHLMTSTTLQSAKQGCRFSLQILVENMEALMAANEVSYGA